MPIQQDGSPRAADPHLSSEERTQVLTWLEESRRGFLAALDGVTGAKWNWKPAPEQWSVGEIAEHIILAEALLFASVRRAVASPRNPDWEKETNGKTEFLLRVLPSRLGRAKAPERIVPRDQLTPDQVRGRFEEQRLEIVQFTRETSMALKEHTVVHPFPIFGTLSAYQWLLYVPLHTMRHNLQIAEVKALSGKLSTCTTS